MPFVFPETSEFILKPRKRTLSLKYVIAIIYIFGGASTLIALLSKFVIEPLFHQLTDDRRSYAQLATKLLKGLRTKLDTMVTVVPPIKSLAGADYVDAQTQTEANPSSSDAPEKDFTEKSMGKELQKLSEKAELSEVDSVKHTLEELSSIVTSLSFSGFGGRAITLDSLMKNKSKKTTEEKNQIDEFKKEIRSIKGSLLSTRNFPR